MMNSHITSFFDGIENGEASITPPTCPIVASASLTDPPELARQLELDPHHHQDVQPQNAHEMPVIRSRIHRAAAKREHGLTELVDHAQQTTQPAEHMQGMHGGQHIEEGAVRIGGEVEALGSELEPGRILSDDKNEAEAESD